MTTKIAIFGVGLIGGSLALCFKGKEGLTVVGHAHRPESASKYISRGVVDSATLSVEEAAIDADFIFMCAGGYARGLFAAVKQIAAQARLHHYRCWKYES